MSSVAISEISFTYSSATTNSISMSYDSSVSASDYDGSISYSWTFSKSTDGTNFTTAGSSPSSSGSITFSNLTAGTNYILKAHLNVYVSREAYYDNPPGPPPQASDYPNDYGAYEFAMEQWLANGGENAYHPADSDSDSETTTTSAYTHPGNFTEYNFTSGSTIQDSNGLTDEKVSHWCDHCNKLAHWHNQNATDVIDSNSDCQVSSGDLITAIWYNACIDAIPILTNEQKNSYHVRGGADGDIITASKINLLGTLISSSNS